MRIQSSALALAALLLSAVAAVATISTPLQMQTGNPSAAAADPVVNRTNYLIQRPQYAFGYNDATREPNWVAWNLTSGDVGGSGRSSSFFQDTNLPAGFYQVLPTDYSGSGYDRGHLCPSADRTVSRADNDVVFYMSNMMPQAPDNNQGVWASFETYCRTLADAGNEMLIIAGPSGFAGSTLASGVGIPGYTWKIAVVVPLGAGTALTRIDAATRVIAIKVPNTAGVRSTPWQNFVTSANQLQTDTGYTFFNDPALAAFAATLRAKVDGQTAAGAPALTTQPVAQTTAVGGSASFSVTATSTPASTLTYQWLKDDVEIAGATASTLSLTNVQAADAVIYTVVVTNPVGSLTSAGAALIITGIPPSITTQPTPKTSAAGTTVSFVVTAAGSPTFTYQWRKAGTALVNGPAVAGATTANLTLSNVQAADAGTYDVVVSNTVNGVSSVTSNAAALTVTAAAPTITTPPASQTVVVASTATLTVAASGTAPFTYQWRKGGIALVNGLDAITGVTVAGATTATLTLTGVAIANSGNYDAVVANGVAPDATSAAAVLSVSTVAPGTQVSYTGGTYAQNFDALPSTGTTTFTGTAPFDLSAQPSSAPTLVGWRLAAGTGTPTLIAGTGSANSGAAYSFGVAGTGALTDRALGTVASGSVIPRFGVMLVNNSGSTITQFTLAYTGEQWRNGGNVSLAAQTLPCAYSLNATDINTGTFTNLPALAFTSPITVATGGALDGNLAANRTALTATVNDISWAPGQTLVIRWNDTNDPGNDHGLAIDDLAFSTPVGTAPVTPVITGTTPAHSATGVAGNAPITVTFNQAVTVASGWFTLSSTVNGALAATVTGGPTTYTLTPPVNFTDNDTVTVTFFASQITETATGTLRPAANTTLTFGTAAPVAVTVATDPQPTTVNAGTGATFTVVAAGTAPFSYQWRKNGTAISGNPSATTATLVLANVQAADATTYDVVVTNSVTSVTSATAALTVTPVAPTVTTAPVAATVLFGNNATFTVAATGTTPFTYQWRKGGIPLGNGAVPNAATVSGATGATLTLTAVTTADAANYDVIVTNSVASAAATAAVALTVTLPPPGPQTNYAGGTYAQNFDTLPSAGTFTFTGTGPYALDAAAPNGVGATGLPGWSFAKASGSGSVALFKFDNGGSNSGGTNSYGTAASSDRSLGSLGSGTFAPRFGIAFVNTTGQTLTTFTLGYTGEQWRRGSATANKLTFAYATGAVDLSTVATGGFTAAPTLDFTAPTTTGSGISLDGNLAANRTVIAPVTVTGLTWTPGQTLVLRWSDGDDSGSDDGLAIDDLTFTAAPALTTQPVAQTAVSGGTATFAVATAATPVTYQWRKNGTPLTGNASATAATLTLAGVTTASAGNYDCLVTNAAGTTTSTAAALIVNRLTATITLGNLAATYDGTAKPVIVATAPAGVPVSVAYAGSPTAPTDAGTYVVSATVNTTEVDGSASTLLTIAQAAQTVTFGALPATVATGIAFTLGATATSALPVTLSVVSGNATVAGNTVTLADTAPVTLRATQSGNNNYTAASADTTVAAGKLAQTIALTPVPAQSSTAAPITLNATATSGLPVSFTLGSGPATLSGDVLTLTGAAGTVSVVAAQAGNAAYNAAPAATLTFAVTVANAAPRITTQPASQVAQTGTTAAFAVVATASPAPSYQWRKDGVTLAGATGSALALANLVAADAGGYDVVVTNSVGAVTSSLARLTVNATATAPVITRQPGHVVALAGRSASFTVVATGSPAPTYQWTNNGAALAGATAATLTLPHVTAADAGTYAVTVTNSAGTATASASLRVLARSYAGTYFGSLGNGGSFALRINDDHTGVFLGFLPGAATAFVSRAVSVDDNGNFSFITNTGAATTASDDTTPARAAAPGDIVFSGTISATGAVSGSATGTTTLALAATKSADTGATAASAGFYQAGTAAGSAQTLVIVSPAGQAFVVTQSGPTADGGTGTVDATGKLTVTTAARGTVSASVSADTAALTATVTTAAGVSTTFTGFADNSAALAQQRIINISTRTTAGIGDQVAIVGFVITGLESKPVLIRAVGPALRGLGVTTALAAPRLDLRSATALLATNTGWDSSGRSTEIAHAAARSGAFPLAAGSADSVILATLAPGSYTAVISAADAKSGVGLVEIYDLSGDSRAQKLANLSTRAAVGTGEATLISGLVVGGTAPKRVLIRAAGPALAPFGVTGALARPALTLFAGATVLAQNSGWSASADSAAIADAAARVGAFAFAAGSADAALIVNLAPGAYTAQVTGVAGATGTTLLEVYELP